MPKDLVVSKAVSDTQRFIPTSSPDLAFNTRTGSLCKTWSGTSEQKMKETDSMHDYARLDSCGHLYMQGLEEDARRRNED